jgi:predicted branched-subunit amino acid permease
MPSPTRVELRAGATAVAPMLVGVMPFALVAGATPSTSGLGGGAAIGLSTIVFAGASQLAAADVLAEKGTALVAIIAAVTINLRLLLYSASLSPHVAKEPLRRRLLMAYLLTDQAYAVSITRWTAEADAEAAGGPAPDLARRWPYYLGAALALWLNWQVFTIVGVLVGGALPSSIPLDFAIPLVFIVLVVPAITTRPAAVAALVGALAAVASEQVGAGRLSVLAGALAGIAAGTLTELALERHHPGEVAIATDHVPPPPEPGLDV